MSALYRKRSLLALAAASAAALFVSTAPAAVLTWNNGGIGDGATWDTAQLNWNTGAAAFTSGTDSAAFSDTNNGNYNISVPASITAVGITATNITSPYNISIAPGQTLSVTSDVSLGQTTSTSATTVKLLGGGNYSQTAGNLTLGLSNALASAPAGNLNASALASFTYNNPTGQILLGSGTRSNGNLTLPTGAGTVNSLIASKISLGDSASGNGGGTSVIILGSGSNALDADTFVLGHGKASASITAAAGGSVTIAGTAGNTNAAISVGVGSSGTATSTASQLNLNGATASVLASTVIAGQLNGATGGQTTGNILFDTGTFTVATSLQIAADTGGNDAAGIKGTFTVGSSAASTGTLDVSGAFIIGNATSTSTTTRPDVATFTMNGGTTSVHTDITSFNKIPANVTITSTLNLLGGTLNMNGNQIGHVSGSNVALTSVNMPVTGKTATLLNLGGTGINDAGLTVNGGGTLALGGTDSYTNNTAIANSSTLLLDGSYTGAGTINATAGTLGGKGSTTGAVSIASGSNLAPGDNSINTLGAGSVSHAGKLLIDLNDSDANVVDLLNDAGALDISAATSNVSFNVIGTPSQAAYVFAKYGSMVGTTFGTVSNIPAGYSINYDYLGQNQIALVAGGSVPEPGSLALLALAAPALLRRRR